MIDAKMVRNIATKYIYDRCPAVVGVGKDTLFAVNSFVCVIRRSFRFCSEDLRKSSVITDVRYLIRTNARVRTLLRKVDTRVVCELKVWFTFHFFLAFRSNRAANRL